MIFNIQSKAFANAKSIVVIFITTHWLLGSIGAQEALPNEKYHPAILDDKIKTVQFSRADLGHSFPAIELNSGEAVTLTFDYLDAEDQGLSYQIIHCNKDWSASTLELHESLEGFEFNELPLSKPSINTQQVYRHYELSIPNNDIRFLVSGNYVLRVFNTDESETTLLLRRFVVYEEQTLVSLRVDWEESRISKEKQSLKVCINESDRATESLGYDIEAAIIQNYDWRSLKRYSEYQMKADGSRCFDTPNQIMFKGGNAYRHFDTKSLKFLSERADYIEFKPPFSHMFLKEDLLRGDKEHFVNEGIDGLFFIRNQEGYDEPGVDADYVWVHFKLNTGEPLATNIYLYGGLTDWQTDLNYMEYNPDKGVYEKMLFLKQGYYNYRYLLKDYNRSSTYIDITEGNHYQNNNKYVVLVYDTDPSFDYHRVIGFKAIDTEMLSD